jgi:hypothetical protein
MRTFTILLHGGAIALLLAASGCERSRTHGHLESAGGVLQTRFPGQVSSGGNTSGQVLARNSPRVTEGTYAGGTPGIAGGSGGNTGGAATGGTVQESGQGPSQGTTQPASAGRPGATLQPGDHGTPSAPAQAPAGATGVQRDNPSPAGPSR